MSVASVVSKIRANPEVELFGSDKEEPTILDIASRGWLDEDQTAALLLIKGQHEVAALKVYIINLAAAATRENRDIDSRILTAEEDINRLFRGNDYD